MLNFEKNILPSFPGPKGLELFKLGIKLNDKKMYHFLDIRKKYGPVVRCKWFYKDFIFVFDPELTHYILKTNHTNYYKSRQYEHMIPLLGNGLLLSEGTFWRKQRALMAKEFHPQRIEDFLEPMQLICNNYFAKHLPLNSSTTIFSFNDIYSFFSELTFQIACELFFGAQVENNAIKVQHALAFEAKRIQNRAHRLVNFPHRFPTLENILGMRAINALNSVVQKIISKSAHYGKKNILSMLMQYRDHRNHPLDAKIIKDEIMTLMLAGHETTSTALLWTIYSLCKNTHYQNLYHQYKNQDPAMQLNLLKAFLLEGMRLYPPVPVFSRRALKNDEFNGFSIPNSASVTLVPYAMHRDPTLWDKPEEFLPERFLIPDAEKKYEHIYIPFAKGPRACIGKDLALLEGQLILKYLLDNFKFSTSLMTEVYPMQHLTLRADKLIPVKFEKI